MRIAIFLGHFSGTCQHCEKAIEKRRELTTAEFEQLRDNYRENVMLAKDVFHNSTPEVIAFSIYA